MCIMEYDIVEDSDSEPKPDDIKLHVETTGCLNEYVIISVDGYSGNLVQPSPIVSLNIQGGRLKLVVNADINSGKPTHIIDLEDAKETNRNTD